MPRKKQKLCFVLMPFKDELKKVYDKAINPACEEAGFKSLRVDELEGVFNINKKIIQYIFKSDAVVADLTNWNPNVFYEMGVAHAIDNKTIMIINKEDRVPFDVSTYRCIQYENTEKGLEELKMRIQASLNSIEHWRQEPSNPVQDYKPVDIFIPKSEINKLRNKLKQNESLLKSTVSEKDYLAIQKKLREKEALLTKSILKANFNALQKKLKQKEADISALQKQLQQLQSRSAKKTPSQKHAKAVPEVPLRSQAIDNLSDDAVIKMLQENDFFDSNKNKTGKGVKHEYEEITSNGQKLVRDHTTGLTWQQSGSERGTYKNARQ